MAWCEEICELCGREELCNEHHLIPRKCHSKRWFRNRYLKKEMQTRLAMLCKSCHKEVHTLIPNEVELGKEFNTMELLRSHPQVKKYVEWRAQR